MRDAFCSPIDVMPYDVEGQDGTAVFPIITSPKREIAGPGSDGRSVAMLDAAADVGLVTRTTFEKSARWKGSNRPFVRHQLITYAPTGKGEPYFRAVDRKATDRTVAVPSFCTAKGEVVDVIRWSDPVDLGGHRVSRVTYRFHGVDPLPVMPEAERTRMAEPREATVPLELHSHGWHPSGVETSDSIVGSGSLGLMHTRRR